MRKYTLASPESRSTVDLRDYRAIIEKKAKEGWRYVGYIPTRQRGTGHIEEMDLVFEKEAEYTL